MTKTAAAKRVIDWYDLLDISAGEAKIIHKTEFDDFTDGMYEGDPDRSYPEAQKRQANYLLDQINCQKNSKILDIGCGTGRIISTAESRGAEAIGITVSPIQIKRCQTKGLTVKLLNYKDACKIWNPGEFDGITANGSLEHFAQPKDVDIADDVYQELFTICHKLLKPGGKFVTTAIHTKIDPQIVSEDPTRFKKNSKEFHVANVLHYLGCHFPYKEQLQRCAEGLFTLEKEVDGTEDYRLTSEAWLATAKKSLHRPQFLSRVLWKFIKGPYFTTKALKMYYISQSWNELFRGEEPPTRLYRHTWKRVD